MKRGIIAAVILTAITVFAVVVNITLTHRTDRLYSLAQAALQDKAALEALSKEWEKQVVYFEFFTDHNYFEHIDKHVRKLAYLDGELYTSACAETLIEFAALGEHLSFTPGNLF